MPTTQLQIEANQRNAQHSTGPKTEAGKAKSSINALRTGLTGRTLMLSAGEADLYEHHVARYACEFNPVGEREHELVQLLADTQWRINSIPNLEAAVYATGRLRHADLFEDETPAVRRYLIDGHVFLTYHRELKNLHIQETRLRRNYAKDLAELTALQAHRTEIAKAETAKAQTARPTADGFEFLPIHPQPNPTTNPATGSPASMMYLHANGRIPGSPDLS